MIRVRFGPVFVLPLLMVAWTFPLRAAPPTDRYGDPLPDGAVSRLGSIRFLHGDWVRSVAFSPDGKTLVSGTQERFFRIWDTATGREVRRFKVKDTSVVRVALSPNGRLIASTGNGGPLTVWDAASGEQIVSRRLGSSYYNGGLAWSPDGKTLALALQNGAIQLFDPSTGRMLRACEKAPDTDTSGLSFSPDGKLLLSSGFYGKPSCIWDATTGKLLRRLEGNADMGDSLTFSPDGKMAAGACSYPLGLRTTRTTFRLWDVASGKKIRDVPIGTVQCAAFSPDGKIVAAGDCQRLIFLIDPATGKVVRQWTAHGDCVSALAFSRDGKVLASGGADKRIHLWDPATGKELNPTPGHRGPVKKIVVTPDGRTVVSASVDRTIRFWDWRAGRERSRGEDLGTHEGAFGLVVSPDGKSLASLETFLESRWKANEVIRLWDPSTGKMLSKYMRKGGDRIGAIAFLRDNKTLAASFWDGSIGLWQPSTEKWLRRLGKSDKGIDYLIPTPDGKSIAWIGYEKSVGIRDLATGADRHIFKNERYSFGTVMALSPDGTALAVQGGHEPLSFWDVAVGTKMYDLELERMSGDHSICGLAFSPDGTIIATAEFREVRLWDLRSRKVFRRLRGHLGNVNSVAFAPDGQTLISASDDGTLLVWDMTGRLREGRLIAAALKPKELEAQWKALGNAEAAIRWPAIWTLAACPQTVSFLSKKMRPIPTVTAERLKKLLADLDDDAFAAREKASRQLAELGEIAGPSLRETLASRPSAEVRRRVEALLTHLKPLDAIPPSEERLRILSGVIVLESIGDKAARNVLQTLASGASQAQLTREAKAALLRLSKRPCPCEPRP